MGHLPTTTSTVIVLNDYRLFILKKQYIITLTPKVSSLIFYETTVGIRL